jgi:hypothetical protein
VSGSSNPEEDVVDWLTANSPTTIAGLARGGFTLEEDGEIEDQFEAEVQYGVSTPAPPATGGTMEYRFNFQAHGAHIYQSLETLLYCTPLGCDADPEVVEAPNHHGALNVIRDGGPLHAEGFQIEPPAETFTLAYYPVNATVSGAYQLLVESLCGLVNNATFRGRPAGSLMLVRCTGGIRTGDDWSIDFGFGYVANDTNIPVGDEIIVTTKDGLDLLWPFYGDAVDGVANSLVKQPVAAYVERVWRRGDFNTLALPA